MDELFAIKIKVLRSMGDVLKNVQELIELANGRESEEKIQCYREKFETLGDIYEECIDCCMESLAQKIRPEKGGI